jgi:adenylate kinase family enzyme
MKFKRIHITGASGSGTTTLGRALAARLGYAFFDADDYFWLPTQPPYQQKRLREDRLPLIMADLGKADGYVLAGSVCNWGQELEASFDFVVFLVVPTEIRIQRLMERETRQLGSVNQGFIEWARQYDEGKLSGRSRALHEKWLAEVRCPVLRLEGNTPVDNCLAKILENGAATKLR